MEEIEFIHFPLVLKDRLLDDGQHPSFSEVPKLLYVDPRTLKDQKELSDWLTTQTLFEGSLFANMCNEETIFEHIKSLQHYPALGRYFDNYSIEDLVNFFESDLYYGYRDVFNRDSITYFSDSFAESNLTAHVVIDKITGDYLGHIYSWIDHDQDLAVYTQLIRRSFRNLVDTTLKRKKKISFVVHLLHEVRKFYSQEIKVQILEPLPSIKAIIKANFNSNEYEIGTNEIEQDVYILL